MKKISQIVIKKQFCFWEGCNHIHVYLNIKEFSGKESPVKPNLPGDARHSGSSSELKNKRDGVHS
jgi:hypothetical protein